MTGYGGSRFRVDMSLLVKILATLFVLPLLYLSGVRLVSQLILPTDSSSLWATPSLDACPRSEAPSFVPRILSLLDPLSSDYKTLLARTLVGQNDPDANAAIRGAVKVSAVDPEGWVLSGRLSGKQGEVDRGFAAFEKALFLNPARPSTYLEAGLCLCDALPPFPADRRALYRGLAEFNLHLSLNLDPALAANPRLCLAAASILAEKGDAGRAVFWLRRTLLLIHAKARRFTIYLSFLSSLCSSH